MINQALIFLGFNSLMTHKRGVENVIHFQSLSSPFTVNYYFHWDVQTHVYHYNSLLCIGIRKNPFWFITLNILLYKLKKRNKKLFIHSHNPLMSIMILYKSNLFTVHDGLYYLMNATKHKLSKIFWVLEKLLYLRCNYVHFISDYTKKMSLYNGNQNFTIIPNTSHFETFKIDNGSFDNNEKWFSSKKIKVFTVRSIEERALINLIIEVADNLKDKDVEFRIAGKGPLLDYYREKIKEKELTNIVLLGYIDDQELIQYYQSCDLVLVTAAYGEGFGLPIIEGYLFDKPVIASNVCAIPEVIISKDFLFENQLDDLNVKLNFARGINSTYEFKKYYDQNFSNEVIFQQMKKTYQLLQ